MPSPTPRRPNHRVQIQFNTGRWPEAEARRVARLIRAAVRATLAGRAAEPGALTVRLVGDAEIRRLNRDFLGHDAVTDVLSFPAGGEDEGRVYFGDLAISAPRARAQARAGGHEVDDE
ncbi:MAG TPA: rRNA maturation RNase YbeY, partial [Anaerolineales bacterium]|nr:rRNA maturation RNase YbeY [Anaerolineales bacterium]